MFLNKIGQVFSLKEHRNLNIEEDDLPLLLTSSGSFQQLYAYKNWKGFIITSEEIWKSLQAQYESIPFKCVTMKPNETICMEGMFNDLYFELTLIDISSSNTNESVVVFVGKDDYMTRLYTDQLGDNWNAFLSNILMRSFLKHGIDVLYLNDSVFQRLISSRCKNFPSKQQLEELIELVKPLKICNHFGEFKKSLY